MLLHLKKQSELATSIFPVGFETVGILVDENGEELSQILVGKNLYLRLPSTRFKERKYQMSLDAVKSVKEDVLIMETSSWKFTIVQA